MKNYLMYCLVVCLTTFFSCKSDPGSMGSGKSAIDMVAEGTPENAEITGAPNVPAPIGDRGPKKIDRESGMHRDRRTSCR